jgi:hypothetical protein
VGDHQRRDTGFGQRGGKLARGVGPGPGVQRGQGLVEQQHLGIGREGPGQRDALSFPAGEGGGPGVGQ